MSSSFSSPWGAVSHQQSLNVSLVPAGLAHNVHNVLAPMLMRTFHVLLGSLPPKTQHNWSSTE